MSQPNPIIDVREMLCAQALALVAQAMEQPEAGDGVTVMYNTEDVKHDLVIWASGRGYRVLEVEAAQLRIERKPSPM